LRIEGIGAHKLQSFWDMSHAKAADEELRYLSKNKIRYSCYSDPDYPYRLKQCVDGPVILFYRGHVDWNNRKIISIVGTRKITTYGERIVEELIAELAPLDPIIVSGFAYGVDIGAHRAAINYNLQTIGVLAHGLNQIYPKAHGKYMKAMEERGGFITDFWSSDAFIHTNFLQRNRIIAGLSEATIVIESAEKGGSLVTADFANGYSRDVFAVPGRTTDVQSIGCNNLIKQQRAHLLTSAADLIYILNWKLEAEQSKPIQKKLFVELNEDEKKIYGFLKERKKELLDSIARQCDIPAYKVAGILLQMELKGLIKPLPGKVFELI